MELTTIHVLCSLLLAASLNTQTLAQQRLLVALPVRISQRRTPAARVMFVPCQRKTLHGWGRTFMISDQIEPFSGSVLEE